MTARPETVLRDEYELGLALPCGADTLVREAY